MFESSWFRTYKNKENKGEGTGIRGKLSPPNLGGQSPQKLATKVPTFIAFLKEHSTDYLVKLLIDSKF